ncbi:oligosaccharide flippase family protein [Vibrio cholerae]|uniref:oligosaccharide flippase family protein n=1 Tax=Vibrio cholerae TaxID=666 RepID=UPI0027DEFA3A|nr:oligosaccharide flippase family protein [Vibrio cholerae]MDQ4622558.1 oligosaccharide flippase family protein [Vibrio cholerae]MDQ4695639.1 oligosaccharide flippase family protein [Vibrio cholerae]
MNISKLLKSIFSLSILKILDYIFPLIILPIVIKSIDISSFGAVSYYLSLSLFYCVIVDFGINVYGTQKVAIIKNVKRIKKLVSASFLIRFILFVLLVVPINFIAVYAVPDELKLEESEWLILIPLLNVLNLQWYYQVREKFLFMIIVSLACRCMALIIILMNKGDVGIYIASLIMMYGAPYIIHYLYFAIDVRNVYCSKVTKKYVFTLARLSSSIFKYRVANAAILPCFNYLFGFTMTAAEFGVMSLVQRIFGAVINFSSPITQALIPHVAMLKKSDTNKFRRIYNKSLKYTFIISLFLSIGAIVITYLVVYLGIIDSQILPRELYPHILIMFSIIPHVINSLQSQLLVLNNQKVIINYAVYISLLMALILCIFGLYFNVSAFSFIVFYLAVYFFMAIYMFLGRRV